MASKKREKVDDLLAGGATLSEGAHGTALRAGRSRILLARADGNLTDAGKYYQQRSGQKLDLAGFDLRQIPIRVDNTETVLMRSGKRVVTRTWDPASGDHVFTKAGNAFYKQIRRNYMLNVPLIVEGAANGIKYRYKSYQSTEKMG